METRVGAHDQKHKRINLIVGEWYTDLLCGVIAIILIELAKILALPFLL